MRIYLDLCCFNRPYDDQMQARIRLETEAKVLIQQKIEAAECELIWSAALDFECTNNPFDERRHAIMQWRRLAVCMVMSNAEVTVKAHQLVEQGLGVYDAFHAASAIAGKADVFVTTDDRLLKRLRKIENLFVMFPGEALAFMEKWYED